MAEPLQGYIELENADGSMKIKLTEDTPVIEGDYTKARVRNSDPRTIWVLYDGKNYSSPNFPNHDGAKIYEVSKEATDYGRPIRSARGFNVYKPGIILFEHFGFRGSTIGPLKDSTPSVTENLISSVIVTSGVWALFSEKDYQGKQLEYKEEDRLGKGSYVLKGYSNDKTKSVKLLRDTTEYP